METSDKSWTVTLILAILLPVHRFYVGKIGTGILYWLTAGGFGIWYIIDIVMIILDKLTGRYPETSIVLTLGDKGAYFADKEKRVYQQALDIIPVDTTGAGDTFTGYFIKAFFLEHESPEHSLEIATYAAAMATFREGAAVSIPAAAEVDGFMKKRGG